MKIMKKQNFLFLCLMVLVSSFLVFSACDDDSHKDKGRDLPLTILQTTDMHNRVTGYNDGTDLLGGFARLAAKTNEIRDGQENNGISVLLVDSGDYTMGTVYDVLWDSDPTAFAYLQQMQYDAVTLGNHEFDYNPQRLADMITAARNTTAGFDVPIVQSNMVFNDDAAETKDDDLKALQTDGIIVPTYLKTMDNGLVVGIIGLIGSSANTDSPNAVPVTFNFNYANATVKAAIQETVDALKPQCHLLIALSHSGLTDVSATDPKGNDVTLAQNITGIDIIFSGHDHDMTPAIVEVANTADATNVTRIVCAGSYTTNFLQLDLLVHSKTKALSGFELTNHTIDDGITADTTVNSIVGNWDNTLDTSTSLNLPYDIDDVVAHTVPALDEPAPGDSALGNLLADSFRYVGTETGVLTFGACAHGTIRNSFAADQDITFADLFATLPLGMTWMGDQDPLLPGYPLLKVYLTGAEIWDVCQFDAKIIQTNLFTEDFVSLSGIHYTYDPDPADPDTTPRYTVTDVTAYGWSDYACAGAHGTDILDDDSTLYPVIIDSYVMAMLLTQSIDDILTALGLSIEPKLENETVITADNMDDARLDQVAGGDVQEYQSWRAFADYLETMSGDPHEITDAAYGASAQSRITAVP